jgi:hypothetical protein
MIFHTIRTISIGDFAEMMEYKDINKVKRFNIWIPKALILKYHSKLIYAWNQIANKNEIRKQISENKHKLKQLIQINIQYPIMLKCLDMVAKFGHKEYKDVLVRTYSYIYKKEPKTTEDYVRLMTDIDLKIRKYKQRYGQEQAVEGIDFEDLIVNVEIMLAPLTIRDKKLYTLPKYIEMASKKIKSNERN